MAEQRLIDANYIVEVAERAWDAWNLAMATQDTNRGVNKVIKRQELCKAVKAVAEDAPTIDPETLPIVQQLRAELARVTAERDAAVADMQALMWYSGEGCEICEHKIVEQRHPYTRLGCKLNVECNPKWCGVEANK